MGYARTVFTILSSGADDRQVIGAILFTSWLPFSSHATDTEAFARFPSHVPNAALRGGGRAISNNAFFRLLWLAGHDRFLGVTDLHFFFVAPKRSSPRRSPAFCGAPACSWLESLQFFFSFECLNRSPVVRSLAFAGSGLPVPHAQGPAVYFSPFIPC
jgi:hypothetical protein